MGTKKVKLTDFIQFTPRQSEAYRHIGKGRYIFYGGARGGGKSHFSLATAVICAMKYPGIHSVCIRETYPELQDVFIDKLQDLYPENIFKYTYREIHKAAYFKNGSKLSFSACDSEKNAKKIQGKEYQLMVIDEANNFDEMTLFKLRGSLRRVKRLDFVPTLLMTGNPGGKADIYFKTRFVNPDFNRWTNEELEQKDNHIFIPAQVFDNPYVGDEYVNTLKSLPSHLRDAWLYGLWNVFEGQFFDEWNEERHVIGRFKIPDHWERRAAIDIGWTRKHPTVALFAAQDPETKKIYIYDEYTAHGVTEQYAREIKRKIGDDTIKLFYADPSMFTGTIKRRYDDESDARIFLKEDIPLMPANRDRVPGWRVVKQWLHWDEQHDPMLQIFETCRHTIETLPNLKYDPRARAKGEDLDTDAADDAADALRYLLVSFDYPTYKQQQFATTERKRAEESDITTEEYMENFISLNPRNLAENYEPLRGLGYRDKIYVSNRSMYI